MFSVISNKTNVNFKLQNTQLHKISTTNLNAISHCFFNNDLVFSWVVRQYLSKITSSPIADRDQLKNLIHLYSLANIVSNLLVLYITITTVLLKYCNTAQENHRKKGRESDKKKEKKTIILIIGQGRRKRTVVKHLFAPHPLTYFTTFTYLFRVTYCMLFILPHCPYMYCNFN